MNTSEAQAKRRPMSTWLTREAPEDRDPQSRVARAKVNEMDCALVGHGVDQGPGDDCVGEAKARKGRRRGGGGGELGRTQFQFGPLGSVQGLVKARPALDEADRECGGETGREALHGIAIDGGELGYLAETRVRVAEVARGRVLGAVEEELN
ncbi:hypothetical protein PanWU01x14_278160 [Parasponia andersonii]|uniref:Uncharacterized protein n=1 Tax=Parasponia andersonii TaxID=3476 RepID=A0A2P5B299_PARAD|nr:hypothetical protein PanWU01x14_278160 [Parasponia andersonii]